MGKILVLGAGQGQIPVIEACLAEGFAVVAVDRAQTPPGASLAGVLGFLGLCMAVAWWIFRTGYRLRT